MGSLLLNYKSFSRIILISIFFDFMVRRLFIVTFMPRTIKYLVTANYIILTVCIVALVFYRIYEFILSSEKRIIKIPIIFGGLGFIILMLVLLYLRTFNLLYYILYFVFYLMLFILYIPLLYLLVSKSKSEYKLAISIFISVFIVSFVLNNLLNISSVIPDILRFENFVFYLNKISIYSILAIILYFSFYSLENMTILRTPTQISKIVVIFIIFLISAIIYRSTFSNAFIEIYKALSIKIIMPDFIYILTIIAFIFSLLKISFVRSPQRMYFFALAIFIMSGLSSSDLYLRVLSIFSLIEMITLSKI